jgi:lipopolysaccharide export system permease protein
MPGSTLNRLIFRELLKVFLLSLGALTGLLVTAGMVQQAALLGLSLTQTLQAVPLFVPNTLPYTIPTTTLFATCVVYGRMSHDNEVVAVRAAGVHLFHLLKPALLLGALAAAGTAALYHTVIPRSQQVLHQQLAANPEELVYNLLRRDRCVRHPGLGYVLYVRDVQGRRLIDVVLKRRAKVKDGRTGQESYAGYDVVSRAREAHLRVDSADGKLYLEPDRLAFSDRNASGTAPPAGAFQITLPDGLNGRDVKVRASALLWDELPGRVAALREEVAAAEARRREMEDAANALENPDQRAARLYEVQQHYRHHADQARRGLRNIEAELYLRPALAAGCLVFALLGCPVGIWANRADYLSTFVICFLPAVFLYYPLLLAGTGMGKDGKLPLPLGCWLANLGLGLVAVLLCARLLRR